MKAMRGIQGGGGRWLPRSGFVRLVCWAGADIGRRRTISGRDLPGAFGPVVGCGARAPSDEGVPGSVSCRSMIAADREDERFLLWAVCRGMGRLLGRRMISAAGAEVRRSGRVRFESVSVRRRVPTSGGELLCCGPRLSDR